MVEAADPRDADREGGEAQRAERDRDILGERAFDLTDEAQGEVKLVVVLPTQHRHPVHRVEQ